MKRIAFLFLLLSFVGCVFKTEKKTASKSISPIKSEQKSLTLEMSSFYGLKTEGENKELLVISPKQSASYKVDNEAVATICESDLGPSLCFKSSGIVTVTATISSGESISKTISIIGAIKFEINKPGTVTINSENNFIDLKAIGGIGKISYSIVDIYGEPVGAIVENKYIPPTRDQLLSVIGVDKDSAKVYLKAMDEVGNYAIQFISVFPSAEVDETQKITLVCDQQNVLSNSYLIYVNGGLPQQYFETDQSSNIQLTKINSTSELKSETIYRVTTKSNCNEDQTYTIILRDGRDNKIDLEVNAKASLLTNLNKDSFKDSRKSELRFYNGQGENEANSIEQVDNSDDSIDINISGGIPPYRIFLSSPKSNADELTVTSETLKLISNDNTFSIQSKDYEKYFKKNSNECVNLNYIENNDQSVAKDFGTHNGNMNISMNDIGQLEGFYRLVIADCNGVYSEYDFYKGSGSIINITNNYLNAGSPFSTFYAYYGKKLEMDVSLIEYSSDQVMSNFNSDFVNLFSRRSSQNPAKCHWGDCITFIPYKIFEGVESKNPAKVKISLTDSEDVTFNLEKYIYPGFNFHYFDRATNQYLPINNKVDQNYSAPIRLLLDDLERGQVQQDYYDRRLKDITYKEYVDFIGSPKDIKISGGVGLLGLKYNRFRSDSELNPNPLLVDYLNSYLNTKFENSIFSKIYNHNFQNGEQNHHLYLSCSAQEHKLISNDWFKNNFYTLKNNSKNFLVNTDQRNFNLGGEQEDIYFSTPLSGHYKVKLYNGSTGIASDIKLNDQDHSYITFGRFLEEGNKIHFNVKPIESLTPFNRRIMDCFNNSLDKCDFWTEDISFVYPEARRDFDNGQGVKANAYVIPWFRNEQISQSITDYGVAKVSRKMRLGAALNNYSHEKIEGIPRGAKVLSQFGEFTLLQFIQGSESRICINKKSGFTNDGVDLHGWNLTQDSRSLCRSGVNISGDLLFPYSHAIFFYQTSLNAAISKMHLMIQGNIITSLTEDINLIRNLRASENILYKLIGSYNQYVYIETNYSPSDNDYYTCTDSPENTNLIVVKNDITTSNSSSVLLNLVPDNLIETGEKIPNFEHLYKTVYEKPQDCNFGNLKKGIIKIDKDSLNFDFYALSNLLPQDFSDEEINKYEVTDYAFLNLNGQENLYVTGVRHDQKSGYKKFGSQFAAVQSTYLTLQYDAPFLIKTSLDNPENNVFKLYEKPNVSYDCHRETQIKNVSLFIADAKDSYPDGNVSKTVNLLMNFKGAYHPTPFNNLNIDGMTSDLNHVGYVALNKHSDFEFFYRINKDDNNIEFIKSSRIMNDSKKITFLEKIQEIQIGVSTMGLVETQVFTKADFVDFRER